MAEVKPVALLVVCPNPKHGTHIPPVLARPNGFRGISLACGCELLALGDNSGYIIKPPSSSGILNPPIEPND